MNFQQLRFVREAVRQNMNLTEVANVLYTSQSGVSNYWCCCRWKRRCWWRFHPSCPPSCRSSGPGG